MRPQNITKGRHLEILNFFQGLPPPLLKFLAKPVKAVENTKVFILAPTARAGAVPLRKGGSSRVGENFSLFRVSLRPSEGGKYKNFAPSSAVSGTFLKNVLLPKGTR